MNPETPEPKKTEELSLEAIQGGGERPPSNGQTGSGGDSPLGPFDLERLLSMRVERGEREAWADKAKHLAEHEPKRLWMNLIERGVSVVVLLVAALIGAALIVIGTSSNAALVSTGCVLLSGASALTYRIHGVLRQREAGDDDQEK